MSAPVQFPPGIDSWQLAMSGGCERPRHGAGEPHVLRSSANRFILRIYAIEIDGARSEIISAKFLADFFERKPVIAISIDDVGSELRESVVRKLVEFGGPSNVVYEIPEEYRPALDTSPDSEATAESYKYYDVNVVDLIETHLLSPGDAGPTIFTPSYAALGCIQDAGVIVRP